MSLDFEEYTRCTETIGNESPLPTTFRGDAKRGNAEAAANAQETGGRPVRLLVEQRRCRTIRTLSQFSRRD
jgi:hypothetical protein